MAAIFLSASVPTEGRAGFETGDPFLIREAVSALVEVILGRRLLVWGGHPAITPMIWAAASGLGLSYGRAVRLYQSRFFEDKYPEDNARFHNVTYTEAVPNDRDGSLLVMRKTMLTAYRYDAAVFIGGMEGIQEEYNLFGVLNPDAIRLPLPMPGGVARDLYFQSSDLPDELRFAIDYSVWFYRLLQVSTTEPRQTASLELEAKRS